MKILNDKYGLGFLTGNAQYFYANTVNDSVTTTNLVVTNFSTGNLVVSGGSISALSNIYTLTGFATNFSTSNARISGGYATGLANISTSGTNGNITASGALITNGGSINPNYLYLSNRLTTATMVANVSYERFFLDSVNSATIATHTITLPTGAEDGRKLCFTAICPITTVTWNGGAHKYLKSTEFTNGNVSLNLQWSQSWFAWLRI